MKFTYSLISLMLVSFYSQAQELRVPLIRPLLSFETGIVGNRMDNITSEIVQYTGAQQSFNASLRWGINAGVFIGERNKFALSYITSLNTIHEATTKANFYSIGFWYQYKALKNKPLFVQLGFSETIANLYIRNKSANPTINDGTLNDYLNDNSNYTIAQFEQWTDGLHLALSYSFFENSLLALSGQLGYLWNFKYGSWQYIHDNLDRLSNTNLPKDNLNGLYLKLNFEFDFVKNSKHEKNN